jgi:hypothetical protein
MVGKGVILCAALVLAACGDPQPDAARGYVKPPLEQPGLVVRGEDVSEMAELGETNRPRPREPADVVETGRAPSE